LNEYSAVMKRPSSLGENMIFSKFIHEVELAKNYFQLFGSGAENAKTNIKASDRSVAPPTDFCSYLPILDLPQLSGVSGCGVLEPSIKVTLHVMVRPLGATSLRAVSLLNAMGDATS
jgi:hypothetical protein